MSKTTNLSLAGGGWGGPMQGVPAGPQGGNFGNSYQQGFGGGVVRNNYQQQRPAPYSKLTDLLSIVAC